MEHSLIIAESPPSPLEGGSMELSNQKGMLFMKTVTIKPAYTKHFEQAKFLSTVVVKGEPRDVYLLSPEDDYEFDSIIIVHGNEEYEFSSFNYMDVRDNFIGNPTHEIAKYFFKLVPHLT
jgi:hypothetical protein